MRLFDVKLVYKCWECEKEFSEQEAEYYEECVGDFWGQPAYQKFPVCPFCGSEDIDEYEEKDDYEDEEND